MKLLQLMHQFSSGLACDSLVENKTCDKGDCPLDCALSDWSRWLRDELEDFGVARDSLASPLGFSFVL